MKVKEVFTNSTGFFTTFQELFADKFKEYYGEIEPSDLDMQVFYMFGEKTVAPILENNATNYKSVVRLICNLHFTQWDRAKDALVTEYSFLDSYRYTETKTGTDTTETADNGSNVDSNKAFNSTSFVDKEKSTTENAGTNKVTYNTTISRTGNTGNYTPQDLILKELEVAKSNFFDMIMQDVIHDLTLSIYE